ncbi:lysostaphin resistance A-like protein [Pseudooceanicola sp. LIPI14-2-Ac024]|uniref:CPBP family intramembrane glutamic endopeptidase n=1 Tax=Pseudooceanicola sp. LIPI14-2-Ac024 TaxID=3344875 RepID=UPI0035CF365B
MRYPAYQSVIEAARPRSQLWRLIAGFALIGAVYTLLLLGLVALEFGTGVSIMAGSGLGTTPAAAFALLMSFLCLYPGLWLALRWLHGRGLRSLVGPWRDVLRDGGRAALAAVIVYAIGLLIPGPETAEPVANLPPARWLVWLVPGLIGLAIQIAAEELLFRGYLQQQLAARFASPLVWLVLPAVGFGLLHYSAAMAGPNAIWLTLPAIAFGLLAADLTARCGNLGPALALHFLNNFAAIMILAPGEAMSGLALFRLPLEMSDPALLSHLPVEIALVFVLWLAARLALRR